MRGPRCTWLLALAGLAGAPCALAGEIAVVGVFDAERDLQSQRVLGLAIARGVDASGEHTALFADALSARIVGREDRVLEDVLLFDARQRTTDGRTLWQQAEVDAAVDALSDAVAAYRAAGPWVLPAREVWDAHMLLAVARDAAGDDVGSRDAVLDALAIRVDRRPDPAVYPPAILEMWEEEQSEAVDDPGKLSLSVPGLARDVLTRAWVDGRSVGAVPAVVPDLVLGAHTVSVRTSDGRSGSAVVDLAAGQARDVEMSVAPMTLGPALDSPALRSAQVGALVRTVADAARVDAVLLAGRAADGFVLQVYAPDADTFGAPVVLSADVDAAALGSAVTALVRALDRDGVPTRSGTPVAYDVSASQDLARRLLLPAVGAESVASTGTTTSQPARVPRPAPTPGSKPKWPMWVGVGVGSAVAVGGAIALGVLLGGKGPADGGTTSGTVVIRPSER